MRRPHPTQHLRMRRTPRLKRAPQNERGSVAKGAGKTKGAASSKRRQALARTTSQPRVMPTPLAQPMSCSNSTSGSMSKGLESRAKQPLTSLATSFNSLTRPSRTRRRRSLRSKMRRVAHSLRLKWCLGGTGSSETSFQASSLVLSHATTATPFPKWPS